jgi:uncharacterized membrane protein YdjX (TVP38/TMEM64 family)
VTRINPIFILILLNVVLILFRDVLLPEDATAAFAAAVESTLVRLGFFGYAGIVAAYVVCGFFFVPLLIPLNILGGALYGAVGGTVVALAGITFATVASVFSARHLFTGMQSTIEKRPALRRLVAGADRHSVLAILMVRFSIVVPYLLQNIALAATSVSTTRITLITAVSAIPGAAIYSFLGAGLVGADRADELFIYVLIPILLMLLLTAAIAWFRAKSGTLMPAGESPTANCGERNDDSAADR